MRFPDPVDEPLVDALRRLPDVARLARPETEELFERAEHHGLAAVLLDAWSASGVEAPVPLAMRSIARQLDHDAHLALLHRLDDAFVAAGTDVVVLKGAFFGHRIYPRGGARGSTDIDLLVRGDDLSTSAHTIEALGYRCRDSTAKQTWSRREHHHDLYVHAEGVPVELHFLAYRGFGSEIASEPLVERSEAVPTFRKLRALRRDDEIAYLCVHAAAHRFGRLGWLYDLALLLEKSSDADISSAARRAAEWGFARSVAFAGALLRDVIGVPSTKTDLLGNVDSVRLGILREIVGEPSQPVLRAASRFVYGTMLADTPLGALRYARRSAMQRARGVLGLEP